MALKALVLEKKLRDKRIQLEELRAVDFKTREAELEKSINEAKTDEERAAVDEAVEAFDREQEENRAQAATLEQEINEIENELSALDAEDKASDTEQEENRSMSTAEEHRGVVFATETDRRSAILNAPETREFVENFKQAAMAKRTITNVGLTIPTDMLELIRENVFEYSKLLNRVRVRSLNGDGRQTIAGTVPEAVWTEMCGTLNEVSFGFNQVTIDGYKVGAFISICNAVLQDSYLNLASEIITMLSQAIGLALDKAILYGLGATGAMPLGIVTRLAQTTKPTGYPANAPEWKNLSTTNISSIATSKTGVAFFQELIAKTEAIHNAYSRGNLFWAMSTSTYNAILSQAVTFDAGGSIVARVNGVMPIIGGDIVVLEFIPKGDIIGGYGDLYLLGERRGIEIASSDEVQFIQDNTVFKATARYDGMPVIPSAFAAINVLGSTVTKTMTFAPDTANAAEDEDEGGSTPETQSAKAGK